MLSEGLDVKFTDVKLVCGNKASFKDDFSKLKEIIEKIIHNVAGNGNVPKDVLHFMSFLGKPMDSVLATPQGLSPIPVLTCRYIPRYTFSWLVKPMWWVIKFLHRAADLTLVRSAALAKELEAASNGEPERPLIVHVGRLGVEKSLDLLKRKDLEKLFSGMPAVFIGMLGGEEFSQAHASRDVFVMPSESETPGHIMSFSENR
ncbi:hypothetical protein HYC85_022262 [Camellia sinensis]|uniref:Glycosyl transferase family 1 domain-containing protein n=1 Tax=Camellia sinensis TaxID=4442 RepID=A0A7J7GLK9_CAMSI|nr:hypothetical protein HYC85_022262 [Camellia sinensis]